MQFVQKTTRFVVKLLNLRLVDRRKSRNVYILANPEALGLHHRPITVRYDSEKDLMEYNLYTRAATRVNNPKDFIKITNV